MSLLLSDKRDELSKVLEFRRFIRERQLKGQSVFLLLKDVEPILERYLCLVRQVRLSATVSKPKDLNDLDPIRRLLDSGKWFLDGGIIHQGMKILSPDDQNKIIKIADVLRGVTNDYLLKDVEDIIESYLIELRNVMQFL